MRRLLSSLVLLSALWLTFLSAASAQNIPAALSDKEFWSMVTEFSEEGGSFPFENFVSNEDAFVAVIPALQRATTPGGAYFGVGPEQNFTYIKAVQPKIAFILDIRRQNMIEHLMYKAMFEMSANRGEFLSRLFSRSIPSGLSVESSVDELFQRFRASHAELPQFEANLKAVIDQIKSHGFAISEEDEKTIAYVYDAFYKGGPDLNYTFNPGIQTRPVRSARVGMPSYSDLMLSKDENGSQQSFLASEESFRFIREMQQKNLIVPLVADFAGSKTIRAVGNYLKSVNTTVSVFYTSNVEQYLFEQTKNWRSFYLNLGSLPLDESSTFLRTSSNGRPSSSQPKGVTGRWLSLTCSMRDLLDSYNQGQIRTYDDVFAMSH